MKIKLILFLIVFSLIPFINASVGYGEIDYGINYKTPPIEFNNNTAFVNASQWWVTSDYGPLDAISDISHSWLSGLAWSVAGHTIDTTLDMNNNDIDDIKNLNGSGNFTTTGDITANTYIGDGSQLTGLLKLDQTTPQTIINGVPLLDTTPNGGANLKSFVNKEYVDLAVTSLGASYYMHDETDATGYKTCYLNPLVILTPLEMLKLILKL